MKASSGATWVCWCMMMVMMIGVMPSSLGNMEEIESEVGNKLGYATVTFNIPDDNAGYATFLENFREAVKASATACGLRSTSNTANYLYVQLNINANQWVRVGIDTVDMYVWGYQDNSNSNKNRARFFKDVPTAAYNNLFNDKGVTRTKTDIEGNYNKLVPKTKFNRKQLELKVRTTMLDAVTGVYGKTVQQISAWDNKNGVPEANFFFVMCQMISEAARFKFMETAIINFNTKSQSQKMIDFQSNWDDVSFAIHTAEAASPKCGNLVPNFKLGGTTYRTVTEIKVEMGILKYKKNKPKSFNKFQKDVLLADEALLESALM